MINGKNSNLNNNNYYYHHGSYGIDSEYKMSCFFTEIYCSFATKCSSLYKSYSFLALIFYRESTVIPNTAECLITKTNIIKASLMYKDSFLDANWRVSQRRENAQVSRPGERIVFQEDISNCVHVRST